MNATGVIGTTPAADVNVTANVHRLVEGTGTLPISGTRGPTAVTMTLPSASSTWTVSPCTASQGWAALASTTRPTGTLVLGNQLGRPPYVLDEPSGKLRTMAPAIKANAHLGPDPDRYRCAFRRTRDRSADWPAPRDGAAGRGCGPREPRARYVRSRAADLAAQAPSLQIGTLFLLVNSPTVRRFTQLGPCRSATTGDGERTTRGQAGKREDRRQRMTPVADMLAGRVVEHVGAERRQPG